MYLVFEIKTTLFRYITSCVLSVSCCVLCTMVCPLLCLGVCCTRVCVHFSVLLCSVCVLLCAGQDADLLCSLAGRARLQAERQMAGGEG